jgi:hypothetical protein
VTTDRFYVPEGETWTRDPTTQDLVIKPALGAKAGDRITVEYAYRQGEGVQASVPFTYPTTWDGRDFTQGTISDPIVGPLPIDDFGDFGDGTIFYPWTFPTDDVSLVTMVVARGSTTDFRPAGWNQLLYRTYGWGTHHYIGWCDRRTAHDKTISVNLDPVVGDDFAGLQVTTYAFSGMANGAWALDLTSEGQTSNVNIVPPAGPFSFQVLMLTSCYTGWSNPPANDPIPLADNSIHGDVRTNPEGPLWYSLSPKTVDPQKFAQGDPTWSSGSGTFSTYSGTPTHTMSNLSYVGAQEE